jgi:mannose-1-phosphate guanylyltransferase
MKAVVLVGGEGTRMRPLTETMPKPLLPLMDRRSLDHVLDHLARHGIHEVVLSSPYLENTFHPFIASRHGDPAITWITETEPLGTGGAVVNALDHVGAEPFFALNGDILTDLDLTQMRHRHEDEDAAVSIALHHVGDARAFGLVIRDDRGRVTEFREKPEDATPGDINAGTYLIEPSALAAWAPGSRISIERDIFPRVISDGHTVLGLGSDAYWLDLGTPDTYLRAHFDMFEGKVHGVSYPAPWVHEEADVDLRAHLGRWVAVGAGARVGADAQVDDTVLHAAARIGEGAHVTGTILAPSASIEAGGVVIDCVLGEASRVAEGVTIEGAKVPPGDVVLEDHGPPEPSRAQ